MDPEFQNATLDDMPVLLEYMHEYYVFDNLDFEEEPARDALTKLISDPSLGSVWLVYSAGEAVGYVVLTYGFSLEFGGRDAFIDELFIQESHRGRGVGTKTIEFAASEAKSAGVNAVHLEVAHRNEGARRVYRSLGFKERDGFMLMSKSV